MIGLKTKKNRNPIPKTMRGKKRYLVVRFFSEQPFEFKPFSIALNELFLSLFGSVGVAKQRLAWRGFDSKKGLLLVQCNALHENAVSAGLLLLHKVGNQRLVPRIMLKSGVLQKALDKTGFEKKQ
jgi:RNase P/RNase MRP subunit POP5